MIELRLTLPAEWVPAGPDGARAFQAVIRDICDRPEEALILHAPTGAGKTHALRLWLDRHASGFRNARSLLVVTPTNALAAEIHKDLSDHLGQEHLVLRWTALDLHDRHGPWIEHAAVQGEAQAASAIVTNPDNLHRFTNHAFAGMRDPSKWPPKIRPAWRALETVGLVVVDEYHAYDEQLIASLLLLLLKLRTARAPPKFLFLSATPNEALPELLRRLGVSFTTREVASEPNGEGRPIKHQIEVTVTNAPLVETVRRLDRTKRTLAVFDRFTELLRLGRLHQAAGVATITGRDTQRRKAGLLIGQPDFASAWLLLATSKVDVGLNIPGIERFHLQPGHRLQQSWQRFGRAGRDRPAEVTIHLDGAGDEALAQWSPVTKEHLVAMLAAFLREERLNVLRVQEWMARYLAFYHHQTPNQHGHRSLQAQAIAVDHPLAVKQYYQTLEILGAGFAGRRSGLPWDERRWQKEIARSLTRLRGDRLQVEVSYPNFHAEGATCLDDLAYVLRWTIHRIEHQEDRDVHVVTEIRDKPQEVLLHYPIWGNERCPVPARGVLPDRDTWRRWTKQIGTSGQFETQAFREALAQWIAAAGPGVIRPLEAMVNEQIID